MRRVSAIRQNQALDWTRDAFGNTTGASIQDGQSRTVTIVNDAAGRAIHRVEAKTGSTVHQLNYYAGQATLGAFRTWA